MKSAVGQVWHWPGTDELILILTVRPIEEGEEVPLIDELNLETGQVWSNVGRSIEIDDRWERIA